MPTDSLEKIEDQFAEIACLCFMMSGAENALAIFNLAKPDNFASYNGLMAQAMTAIQKMLTENLPLNFASICDKLDEAKVFAKLGGRRAIVEITKTYPVKDNQITFNVSDEMILCDAETVARIVRERARRRAILDGIKEVQKEMLNPEGGMNSDLACAKLSELSSKENARIEYAARSDMDDYDLVVSDIKRLTSNESIGLLTPFEGFNELTGGLKGNDYLVLGALDKHGKSSMALALINYIARVLGFAVAFISLEMDKGLIRKRRIAMNSERMITIGRLLNNRVPLSAREEAIALGVWDMIARDPFYIVDSLRTEQEISMEIQRLVIMYGVQVVVIDYFQKAQGKGDREAYLSSFSQMIADNCLKYAPRGFCAIVCNQFNDEGAKRQRIFGSSSNAYSYGSKQINKDATIKSVLQLEVERFYCGCEKQTIDDPVYDNGRMIKPPRPRWEYIPTSGLCPDCIRAGRDGRIRSENPVREGKWIIEGARNTRGGRMIPYKFDGDYMLIEELTEADIRATGPVAASASRSSAPPPSSEIESLFD